MNIVLYTNILTPYRKYFYDLMYEECVKHGDEFSVFVMAKTEPDRNWKYEELKAQYTHTLKYKTLCINGKFIHINKDVVKEISILNPDIIICAGGYLNPGIWQILRNKKKFNYKVLFWSESHLKESRNYKKKIINIREKIRNKIYKKFDGFCYAGKFSKELIERYANPNARYIFLPNVVDNEKYCKVKLATNDEKRKIKERYNLSNEKVLFCPARLTPVKGIGEFFELYSKVTTRQGWTFLIAGDGEQENYLKNLANKLNIKVQFLGYKNQNEIIDLYKITDVFVMPSLSDSNPLSVIEALWCGLPILLSDCVGNYPETVVEGKNGYVFSYDRKVEAIDKINKILTRNDTWFSDSSEYSIQIANRMYNSSVAVKKFANELRMYKI